MSAAASFVEPVPHAVVVGVDGSPASRQALTWAIVEGAQRQTPVVALHAFDFPATALVSAYAVATALGLRREDAEAFVISELQAVDALGHLDTGAVVVVAARGRPGPALIAAADRADLLVVGSRGMAPVVGKLLGSVSGYCLRHAPCPLVILPPGVKAPLFATLVGRSEGQ